MRNPKNTRLESGESSHQQETVGMRLSQILQERGIWNYNTLLNTKDLRRRIRLTKPLCLRLRQIISDADEIIADLYKIQLDHYERKHQDKLSGNQDLQKFSNLGKLFDLIQDDNNGLISIESKILNFFNATSFEEIEHQSKSHQNIYYSHNTEMIHSINLYGWITKMTREFQKIQGFSRYNHRSLQKWLSTEEWLANIESPCYFKYELPLIFKNMGICLIFIPYIKKSIAAASTWINGTPVIAISDKYKDLSNCWIYLLHEIGHILRHPGKTFYCSNPSVMTKDQDLFEEDANQFVRTLLLKNFNPSENTSSFTKNMNPKKIGQTFQISDLIAAHCLRRINNDYTIGPKIKIEFE